MSHEFATHRRRLFDAAEQGDWPDMWSLLEQSKERTLNIVRPGCRSWYTLLHHAAARNAPAQVVEELLAKGHFRSIRCAAGARPMDLARRHGNETLIPLLEPPLKHRVPEQTLAALEEHFHAVIRETAESSFRRLKPNALRLPPLEVLLEHDNPTMTFLVPYMFGGFVFRLQPLEFPVAADYTEERWVLLTRSYCRILDGEELDRRVITPLGSVLMTKGPDPES